MQTASSFLIRLLSGYSDPLRWIGMDNHPIGIIKQAEIVLYRHRIMLFSSRSRVFSYPGIILAFPSQSCTAARIGLNIL